MTKQSKTNTDGKESNEICMKCRIPTQKTPTHFKGIKCECYKCPKCKETFFTEEQMTILARAIDAQRMKESYSRQIVTIGHSRGLTLPKEVVDFFRLDKKDAKVVIVPDVENNVIALRVGK